MIIKFLLENNIHFLMFENSTNEVNQRSNIINRRSLNFNDNPNNTSNLQRSLNPLPDSIISNVNLIVDNLINSTEINSGLREEIETYIRNNHNSIHIIMREIIGLDSNDNNDNNDYYDNNHNNHNNDNNNNNHNNDNNGNNNNDNNDNNNNHNNDNNDNNVNNDYDDNNNYYNYYHQRHLSELERNRNIQNIIYINRDAERIILNNYNNSISNIDNNYTPDNQTNISASPSNNSTPERDEVVPSTLPSEINQQVAIPSFSDSPEEVSLSTCSICMTNRSRVVFVPCGHVCSCLNCSQRLTTCPLCRSNISVRQVIYC